MTQPTVNTVVRYNTPTPVLESARGRHGCWQWSRKTNSTARTSLERYVVVIVIFLLIACLGFLVLGILFRPDCSDGKTQCHFKFSVSGSGSQFQPPNNFRDNAKCQRDWISSLIKFEIGLRCNGRKCLLHERKTSFIPRLFSSDK